MSVQQAVFFVIALSAFGLLITRRMRIDVVAILIILTLSITGLLTPEEALAGFSSEPAIVVAAIFVMSAAIEQTGLAELAGAWIGRLAGRTYSRAIITIMPAVALLSAFTHHLTTTAIMLPIVLNFSKERNIAASKLLMPLAFAASLGTTITIIGAPAFLVASDALRRGGGEGLSVFSVTPIGIALSIAGTIYVLLVARFLLPDRGPTGDVVSHFRLNSYFTEITVQPNSPLIGRPLSEVRKRYRFSTVGWDRDGRQVRRPFDQVPLEAGDVLRIYTTPEDLATIRQDQGIELTSVEKFGDAAPSEPDEDADPDRKLVQAIVAPTSDLIGRSLREVNFYERYGPVVVGLWRQAGFVRTELAEVRLRGGDVLVLLGDEPGLERVGRDPAFLTLMPFQGQVRLRRKAPLAGLIMLVTVVIAALNVLSLEIAVMAGALAVVLTNCITPRQAYRAIDPRIFVFIAGAIPLGAAMQKSGAGELVAGWLGQTVSGWSPFAILLAIFIIVGIITQFLSDAATTALFAPIAVSLAGALGLRPEPFAVTVAMASITAFITPIGHHGNLVIFGPGRYTFGDFVRTGLPLTAICAVVVAVLALIVWP